MNIDMDMDVAWCLTCSKQTRDPRSPYCSEDCRLQDTDPTTQHVSSVPLTSPVPFGLMISPVQGTQASHPTPRANVSPIRRPSIGPLAPLSSSSRSKPVPRDRRAFSFPATHSATPIDIKISSSRRPTQTTETLQFARKAFPVAVSSMAASPGLTGMSQGRSTKGFDKLSKTTGANTPIIQDSVFCSTSESSDNEVVDLNDVSPMKISRPLVPLETTIKPTPSKQRGSVPHAFLEYTSSHKPTPIDSIRPPFISRKSPSPVAALIASSASSKSRDDIVSWLNDVKRMPIKEHDGEQDHSHLDETYRPRGRSRTRREVLANLPPPSQEPLDDNDGDNGVYGTTPKGRIGSALAGLTTFSAFGVGPIVKALTGASSTAISRSTNNDATSPATTSLGLQPVPASAEVSRIAVTAGPPSESEINQVFQMGGATPTLSTISFSEAIDPLTDNGDHIDFMSMADDQSLAGSSSFARKIRTSGPTTASAGLSESAFKKQPANGAPRARGPITSTASAIWNLSTYLRSFAPFSVSSVIPPYVPFAAAEAQATDSTTATAATSPTQTHDLIPPISAPVPAYRPEPTQDKEEESPAQQMVRSLPMNIILPLGGENPNVERMRLHEMREWLGTPRTKSISRSRSRSWSRGQSKSRGRQASRSSGHSRSASHGRKVSYDADASEEDECARDDRRGRSRREKILRKSSDERRAAQVNSEVAEDEQDQDRDRVRGRGRERAARV